MIFHAGCMEGLSGPQSWSASRTMTLPRVSTNHCVYLQPLESTSAADDPATKLMADCASHDKHWVGSALSLVEKIEIAN